MKLASLKDGGRDGCLIVVNRDLSLGVKVPEIAGTLQQAIENWEQARPALEAVAASLAKGTQVNTFPLNPEQLASPFPRAFQFLDGSVYLHHMEKARKARGAEMPPNYKTEPLMYQGLSDRFIAPRDAMPIPDETLGLDYEAELAVVVDDVPMGTTPAEASKHIKLLMLLNDYTLRTLTRTELPKGFGFMQAKPTSSFSLVAVTPDELGGAWDGEKLDLPILSFVNGQAMGRANTARDMFFTYPTLIAHAARTRSLSAGTIIGAGAVSNLDHDTGYACLAEKRADEELSTGKASTPWLRFGDSVRIDMHDATGQSIFGAIENTVTQG
jgi:fumarylacetoacetate (FAA) hydrolase